jgi:hypothetical protein
LRRASDIKWQRFFEVSEIDALQVLIELDGIAFLFPRNRTEGREQKSQDRSALCELIYRAVFDGGKAVDVQKRNIPAGNGEMQINGKLASLSDCK